MMPASASLGGVAQLVRALACHARGRGFESRHSRHEDFPENCQLLEVLRRAFHSTRMAVRTSVRTRGAKVLQNITERRPPARRIGYNNYPVYGHSPPHHSQGSYARKLVTVLSGGAFNLFDAVLEFHPLDDFCELA